MSLSERLARSARDPQLIEAASALAENRLGVAERILKGHLMADPLDIAAIRMLAEVAGRLGRYGDAERLLARALDLAPDFHAARANYVTVLHKQSKFASALDQANRLLDVDGDDPNYLALKAQVLVRTGDYGEAIASYRKILGRFPEQSRLWISLGHVLKTVGEQAESIAAYRRAVEREPTLGDGWWSLANLKTVRLGQADIRVMEHALERARTNEDRYHLEFALGKALEDAGRWADSFTHYAEGNRLRRRELPYDPEETTRHAERTRALMTAEALERGGGEPATDPIFIVGLPRAGSTLIEQILASHSLVEGTMELPDIGSIAADLSGRGAPALDDEDAEVVGYLPRLLASTPEERAALGQRYLDNTRIQRKTSRPRFTDKMPNNFAHIGLIHLILPKAIIIDARRHPMANGFSVFKQHFARGQGFGYSLEEIGRYYRDYLDMMDHYDRALPGRVFRVIHEDLVADPERGIRALLAHCGLPFEHACLRPHETKRAVRTASSEQVRRPIGGEAVDHWRHYEPWLGPLATALGDAPARYRTAYG